MNGGVRIRTELGDDGGTRLVELSATAPYAVKNTPQGVHIVGAAASPLDGDQLFIDLDIGAGTSLVLRTVAATMAWPSRIDRGPSVMTVTAKVGEGARLHWLPEPIVPVQGCRHELHTRIELARTACLLWREEIILGRANEGPGSLLAMSRIEREGEALLHQRLVIDGTAARIHAAPGIIGEARATGSVLAVGPGTPEHTATIATSELHGAVLELEGGGRLASATAASVVQLRHWLDAREAALAADSGHDGPSASAVPVREVAAR